MCAVPARNMPAWQNTCISSANFEYAAGNRKAGPCIASAAVAPEHAAIAGSVGEHRNSERCDGIRDHSTSSGCHLRPNFTSRIGSGTRCCCFAALSLGEWRLRLPALTERSPPYDPWDAASQEAPRGVRRRVANSTLPLQPAGPTSAQPSTPFAAVQVQQQQQHWQQQQQQPAPPQAHPPPPADAQLEGTAGRQTGGHSAVHGAGSGRAGGGGLPTWLVSVAACRVRKQQALNAELETGQHCLQLIEALDPGPHEMRRFVGDGYTVLSQHEWVDSYELQPDGTCVC